MAFSTEFIMGAGGPEVFEPPFTPNTSRSRLTLATQSVGEGQWLVAVDMTRHFFSTASLWVNNVQTIGQNDQEARVSTISVVSGPGTITVEGIYIASGNAYIVRIG